MSNILLNNYAKDCTNNSLDCTLTMKRKLITLTGVTDKIDVLSVRNKGLGSTTKNPKSLKNNSAGMVRKPRSSKNNSVGDETTERKRKNLESKVVDGVPTKQKPRSSKNNSVDDTTIGNK